MIIPKDIFRTVEDSLKLLLYLYSVEQFTASELIEKFNLSKWTPYKHLIEWKEKEWLLLKSTTSTKGGKTYSYSLTKKSLKKLISFCEMLVKEYKLKEELLKKINQSNDVLDEDQKKKMSSIIEQFFTDFFK